MRKYLLPESGNFYKANLHSHSTLSDGMKTPKELKEMYKAHGYSVFAITDHNRLVTHNDLTDNEFLFLNGYESDITEPMYDPGYNYRRTCHLCMIAPTPDVEKAPLREECGQGYNAEHVNALIKRGRDEGFFVTYNHPTWSRERYPEYMSYHGMNAMEIVNFGCIASGTPEWNEHQYDEMLQGGERIFCTATDDNHNTELFNDSFGGFTMIKADKLEYRAIFDALINGNFYASEGPEIHQIYIEDNCLSVFTSPAASIRFNTYARHAQTCIPQNERELITSASFRLKPEDKYVRVTVTDTSGKNAYTSAYWFDAREEK